MIRSIILSIFVMLFTLTASAEGEMTQPQKFNPAKFEADLEQFITTEAGLSPQEASSFFPLYREMQRKQRALFGQMRRYRNVNMCDEKACSEAISKQDAMDLEIKEIQQTYHKRFMKIISARKLMRVIKAEEKFHRLAFKRMAKHSND